MKEACVFCNIVSGEMPSYKVYEDESFLAFMDIFPRVKGHVLVIPKKHYTWVYDVPEFGIYWEVTRKISLALKKLLNARFISYVTWGEEVPHAHIHILPQTEDGMQGIQFTKVKDIPKEEILRLSEQITSQLSAHT